MEELELTAKKLQLMLVHAAYGRAMMKAHQLEMHLSTLLLCHAIENKLPSGPDHIKRMTLGTLAREFVEKYGPSDYVAEEIDNMVFFRNELAHRISEHIVRATTDEEWHEKFIEELGEVEDMFVDTIKLLGPYMEQCYRFMGATHDDLLAIVNKVYIGARAIVS
ncbi:hypothetical protein [Dyella sp.]|uniref:hypothetical protein n=1 Tax=Dyella sp. TaxID=1869338 RepID=UPI003F7DD89B